MRKSSKCFAGSRGVLTTSACQTSPSTGFGGSMRNTPGEAPGRISTAEATGQVGRVRLKVRNVNDPRTQATDLSRSVTDCATCSGFACEDLRLPHGLGPGRTVEARALSKDLKSVRDSAAAPALPSD